MARLEVALRSPIAFRRRHGAAPPLDVLKSSPERAVGIGFEGRTFFWHYVEPRDDPELGYQDYGPSVTVEVQDDGDARVAADVLQQFLSAVAFLYDQEAEVVHYGGSGEPDPFHAPIAIARRSHLAWFVVEPPDEIKLGADPNLRLAVAHYREGLNAGSPFYRFLAFWNCLDATFGVVNNPSPRDTFLRNVARRWTWAWPNSRPFPIDPARDLERESRHALAHVLRPSGRRTVNPDHGSDRARLDEESRWLQVIARAAIEQEYQDPVTTSHATVP
jgi:hypothetical protein